MSAIDFVVRDDAGTLQRGSLAGADGSSSVLVAAGQDLSLNLQRGNILSYVRQGQSLQITLVDGQVITIDGFFGLDGSQTADLFISASGSLSKVDLVTGDGNLLYAQYLDSDSFGKWSPDDSLYFLRGSEVQVAGVVDNAEPQAGMLATPLLGAIGGLAFPAAAAAGLGGALLLGSTSGNGDSTDGDVNSGEGGGVEEPEVGIVAGVQGTDHMVNEEDHADGVTIGGTGTPGATGTITVGDVTRDITIDENGEWEITFTPEEVEGGEYTTDVTVTVSNDGGTATTTDKLVVDTIAEVTFANDIVETDGTINFAEESDGFVLTGTTQEGSSVVVSFGGQDYNATVTGSSWSLNVNPGVIQQGEYDLNVSVSTTDTFGNTASTSGIVRVDTVTSVTINTSTVGNDGTVNAEEHASGVTVGGNAQPNAEVVVTATSASGQTVTQTVTATQSGTWTATFSSSQIEQGTYDLNFTAVATDTAGNTASASGTVHVDTELSVTVETAGIEGDGVVNAVERSDGVLLTGQTEPNALVEVNWGGSINTVRASSTGEWSANFAAGSVPQGTLNSQVSVKATDAAGNVATTTGVVVIDTELDVTVNTDNVTADGVVNFVERQDGLTLTGTTEANAQIDVTFNGVSRSTTADGNGNWSADWPASAVPDGERLAAVQVTSTDAAGNVATTNGNVRIDTFVNRLQFGDQRVEGDDIVNNAEASDGLTLGGSVEAGSTVSVTYTGPNGVTVTENATVTGGSWSVTFAADQIPQGTYEASVTVNATDAAGNTRSITDTFAVDTDAPETPDIINQTDQGTDGIVGFTMADPEGEVSVSQVELGGGAASDKDFTEYDLGPNNSIVFGSGEGVQDGSHLIVTDQDTSGNTSSTLFVMDDQTTNDFAVGNLNTDGFNIGEIHLTLAEDTNLTLSTQDIKDLSDNDNRLVIKGETDDTVTVDVDTAPAPAGTESFDGRTFNVYTLDSADDTTLLVEQGINFSTI